MTHKQIQLTILSLLIISSSISTFVAGYLTHAVQFANNFQSPIPITTQNPQPIAPLPSSQIQSDNKFTQYAPQPGEHYFDDTIIAISKQPPYEAVVATVSRSQNQKQTYQQVSRVSYFNGKEWTRKIIDNQNKDALISDNELIKQWNHYIDASRVLREQVTTEISLNDQLKIRTQSFDNEITMRSLPGYTKLMSETEGTIFINDKPIPAHIVFTKIYSLNTADLHFYDSPLGITTDWAVLWSQSGEFFHIDATSVEREIPTYTSHQVAIKKDINGGVFKTFDLIVKKDNAVNPSKFTLSLNSPIETQLQINRTTILNKAPNANYNWIMGHALGDLINQDQEKVQVHGLIEYIKD